MRDASQIELLRMLYGPSPAVENDDDGDADTIENLIVGLRSRTIRLEDALHEFALAALEALARIEERLP